MAFFILTGLVIFSVFVLTTTFIWSKIEFNWLAKICRFLVLSLPFERIPSVDFGFGSIRISQLLTLLGLYFLAILLFKKNKDLLKHKLDNSLYLMLGFFLFSIPSWFMVQDFKRFLVTMVGTILVFLAYFLLSNFTQNILERLRELSLVLVFVCLFGMYQFFGDLIGIPPILTGLRQNYTKLIFGIPRIHSTALEPLYFAGMLFPGIFSAIFFIANQKPIFKTNFKYSNLIILSLFLIVFLLTISKGAFLSLALILPFLGLIFVDQKLLNRFSFIKNLIFLALVFLAFISLFSPEFNLIINGILGHFVDTFTFRTGTSAERLFYVEAANFLLFYNIIFGIGSGQFGGLAKPLVPFNTGEGEFFIVNNVYLEVWLEFGLLALIIFLIFMFRTIFVNYQIYRQNKILNSENLARLILISSLSAYFINWLFFSPIFIMPIFILMGLASNLISQKNFTS